MATIKGITIKGATLGGASVVAAGLNLYLDAGISASYSGTGTTWTDLSTNADNASLLGTYTWNSAGLASYFNFAGGYAAPTSSLLPNTTYTKCIVFRYGDGGAGTGNFISGTNDDQHAFWLASGPYVNAGHNGNWYTVVSPTATIANQWYFAAVSFSNVDGWRLYVNNDTPVTNSDTAQFTVNPAVVQVSAYDSGNFLTGDIGAALCYNRVLTDAEIAQNYNYFRTRYGF